MLKNQKLLKNERGRFMENINFSDLGLNEKVLQAIDALGFEEPSQIQAEAIPQVLNGIDIIGQAQTGTGKTLAFGAPVISMLQDRNRGKKINALILTPTRELAIQINDELIRLGKFTNVKSMPIYGGQPIDRQIKSLHRGVDIVVGTPGRIIDHLNRGSLNVKDIDFLIIDEADEMLNMGFIDDIEDIIKNTNDERQTLLFSATMPDTIKKLASRYLKKNVKHIIIAKNSMTVSKISQYYYEIKNKDRFEALCRILDVDEPSSAIIFCKTKRGVDELVENLQSRAYNVEGMHGDMGQSQRLNTLRKFKEGNLDFLVATDVAARGIDVDDISHVINYDLPQDSDSYVHRIGRTGRANKEGIAYTLVTPREYMSLKAIEKATRSKILRKEVPTIDEIFETKYKNIIEETKEVINSESHKNFIPIATKMDEDFNLIEVAAALMKMLFDKEVSYEYVEQTLKPRDSVRLFLSCGRMDNINPKTLVLFLADNAGINKSEVGDIDILNKFSFVNIPERYADVIIKKCAGKKINGRRVGIEIAKSRD